MAIDPKFLLMEWENGFEATLDARVVLADTFIPMTPVPEGDFGRLVLEDTSKENFEIIRYNRKDAAGVYVETVDGGIRNEDGTSTGIHPRGARVRGNITAQDIRELRAAAKAAVDEVNNAQNINNDWRNIVGGTPTVVGIDGQRQVRLNVPGDMTAILQPGHKVRIPRTGTTPTQSASFIAANSQYAVKTSPTGITFTSQYTAEGWFYIDSYPSSGYAMLINRMDADANNGWWLQLDDKGKINLVASSGGVNRSRITYQSVPLGEWVHIAGAMDAANPGAITIHINGMSVPVDAAASGAGTAINNTGDLSLGRYAGGQYFNGKMSNIRIWSTLRTTGQIRDNMNQQITGPSTGLVASFLLSNNWNDTSGNNNHLTGTGGAVNNFLGNPFNANEHGIVTQVGAFAGGVTPLVVFTGRSNNIPNETLGQLSYSTARSPLGFNADETNWTIEMISPVNAGVAGSVGSTIYNPSGLKLDVPIGAWSISWSANIESRNTGTTTGNVTFALSSNVSVYSDRRLVRFNYHDSNVSQISQIVPALATSKLKVSSVTPMYLLVQDVASGASRFAGFRGDLGDTVITAKCAYI